jgi:hypothetical protein
MDQGLDVSVRWPELFAGVPTDVTAAVVQSYASDALEGGEPRRDDVADLVELRLGKIDRAEYSARGVRSGA